MFDRYIQNGLCQASCSFTLTQGESIECIVTVPTDMTIFILYTGSATLTWETAQANMNFGGCIQLVSTYHHNNEARFSKIRKNIRKDLKDSIIKTRI